MPSVNSKVVYEPTLEVETKENKVFDEERKQPIDEIKEELIEAKRRNLSSSLQKAKGKKKKAVDEILALSVSGKSYPQQVETANEIVKAYKMGIRNHLVVAKCQVGKTGTAGEAAEIMIKEGIVREEDVYIITNMNDRSWDESMKKTFSLTIQKNIIRRAKFKFMMRKIRKLPKDRVKLIVIDEPQYGSGINQTLNKTFQGLGFKSIKELRENNVCIIQLSATFDACAVKEAIETPEISYIHTMKEPEAYNGYDKLDIRGYENFNKIEDFHEEVNLFVNPKYHILRVCKVKKSFGEFYNHGCQFLVDYDGAEYDYKSVGSTEYDNMTLTEFNELLKAGAPERHTICHIKNGFKASNTICKTHLGHWYEFIATPEYLTDSNICQAGPGRWCGYGYEDFYNGPSIMRTHTNSIKKYLDGFDDYVKMTCRAKNKFTTTARDKYNKDSFNTLTELPTTLGQKTVEFDDVFCEEEYNLIVEAFEKKEISKKKFKKYIKDVIEEYHDTMIKKKSIIEEYKKQSVDCLNTQLVHHKKGKAMRIKNPNSGRDDYIVTEKRTEKFVNEFPVGVRSFQCLPVYPNRNPNDKTLPKFLFVYSVYHKDENKKAEDIYDIWSKDFIDEDVNEFEVFYKNYKASKFTFKVFYKKYRAEMTARKLAEKEHREELMKQKLEAAKEALEALEGIEGIEEGMKQLTVGVKGEYGF